MNPILATSIDFDRYLNEKLTHSRQAVNSSTAYVKDGIRSMNSESLQSSGRPVGASFSQRNEPQSKNIGYPENQRIKSNSEVFMINANKYQPTVGGRQSRGSIQSAPETDLEPFSVDNMTHSWRRYITDNTRNRAGYAGSLSPTKKSIRIPVSPRPDIDQSSSIGIATSATSPSRSNTPSTWNNIAEKILSPNKQFPVHIRPDLTTNDNSNIIAPMIISPPRPPPSYRDLSNELKYGADRNLVMAFEDTKIRIFQLKRVYVAWKRFTRKEMKRLKDSEDDVLEMLRENSAIFAFFSWKQLFTAMRFQQVSVTYSPAQRRKDINYKFAPYFLRITYTSACNDYYCLGTRKQASR